MKGSILLRYSVHRLSYLFIYCGTFLIDTVFQGAVVFSNIVTTVSPTYAQEVRRAEVWFALKIPHINRNFRMPMTITDFIGSLLWFLPNYHKAYKIVFCFNVVSLLRRWDWRPYGLQGGHGLHSTLNFHSKKFFGILNGIDTDVWNPTTDSFIKVQYNANDLQGKAENKDAIRRHLGLSSNVRKPLVSWPRHSRIYIYKRKPMLITFFETLYHVIGAFCFQIFCNSLLFCVQSWI